MRRDTCSRNLTPNKTWVGNKHMFVRMRAVQQWMRNRSHPRVRLATVLTPGVRLSPGLHASVVVGVVVIRVPAVVGCVHPDTHTHTHTHTHAWH